MRDSFLVVVPPAAIRNPDCPNAGGPLFSDLAKKNGIALYFAPGRGRIEAAGSQGNRI